MEGYLGEEILDIHKTEYVMYTKNDWILFWIERNNFDGAHHKNWLIDQIARIANGTNIQIKKARWSDGTEELRFSLLEPTVEYKNWVKSITEYDGEVLYEYDCGIAP